MRKWLMAGVVCLAVSIVLAMRAPGASGMQSREMTFQGRRRTYLVYRPRQVPRDRPLPVVLVFHGGGGSAAQMARTSRMNTWADRLGLLVVYPEGVNKHWNDGRRSEKFRDQDRKIDDVAWIARLLTELQKNERIDPRRIYAMGVSNGGMFTLRLAVELSDRFDAVAAIVASLPEPLAERTPRKPLRVLIMNGTDDPLVPYGGGEVTIRSLLPQRWRGARLPSRGRVLSTKETVAYWLRHNRIDSKGHVDILADRDRRDGCRIERTKWSSTGGREVVLYKIMGGGHGIPGRRQYLPRDRIGNICQDIDAAEVICNFFLRKADR